MVKSQIDIIDNFLNHPLFSPEELDKLLFKSEIDSLITNELDKNEIHEIGISVIQGMEKFQEAWEKMYAFKHRRLNEENLNLRIRRIKK
jgi:hypothetical protein